ncbi:MAG: hypothetical protein WCA20_06965 [Candidatus Sulfotelmatobacter sp.]
MPLRLLLPQDQIGIQIAKSSASICLLSSSTVDHSLAAILRREEAERRETFGKWRDPLVLR